MFVDEQGFYLGPRPSEPAPAPQVDERVVTWGLVAIALLLLVLPLGAVGLANLTRWLLG